MIVTRFSPKNTSRVIKCFHYLRFLDFQRHIVLNLAIMKALEKSVSCKAMVFLIYFIH